MSTLNHVIEFLHIGLPDGFVIAKGNKKGREGMILKNPFGDLAFIRVAIQKKEVILALGVDTHSSYECVSFVRMNPQINPFTIFLRLNRIFFRKEYLARRIKDKLDFEIKTIYPYNTYSSSFIRYVINDNIVIETSQDGKTIKIVGFYSEDEYGREEIDDLKSIQSTIDYHIKLKEKYELIQSKLNAAITNLKE